MCPPLSPADKPIKIAVVGDSAGGNFSAALTIQCILHKIRKPDGVHLIYPALDFAGDVWKTETLHKHNHNNNNPNNTATIAHLPENVHNTNTHVVENDTKALLTSSSSTSTASSSCNCPPSSSCHHSLSSSSEDASPGFSTLPPAKPGAVVPQLSSRTLYAFDGVLPLKFQLLLADAYFADGGDPVHDVRASPQAVWDEVLTHFPPLYAHCGSVDPLVDDVVRFCSRVVQATKQNNQPQTVKCWIIPKVSHAYMQVTNFLPEGRKAFLMSAHWLAEILEILPHELPQPLKEPQECSLFISQEQLKQKPTLKANASEAVENYLPLQKPTLPSIPYCYPSALFPELPPSRVNTCDSCADTLPESQASVENTSKTSSTAPASQLTARAASASHSTSKIKRDTTIKARL